MWVVCEAAKANQSPVPSLVLPKGNNLATFPERRYDALSGL